MRNVLDKICRENRNTRFLFNKFFPENHAVSEIMWKNIVESRQAGNDSTAHAICILYN